MDGSSRNLKQQIDKQDKNREAYFDNFNSLSLKDYASLEDLKSNEDNVSVNRPEDKPGDDLTEEQNKAAQDQQSQAAKQKQKEIDTIIKDPNIRANATAKFAYWQKNMENIQIHAGKRNIFNTYVWDADGGLRAEAQSFANTAEHSIGGSFSLNASLGGEGKFSVFGAAVELTAQATFNFTQTMTKTETHSRGIQLNVDLSGVESRGVTDYNDYPILPGEKVNRYRFMSFYLEGSTHSTGQNFSI